MTQVTESAIPADTLALQDLQNTGVMKSEMWNVVTSQWGDKVIDSAQDVSQFRKLYQDSLSNYKKVALVANFENNVITEIAPKAGTIPNTPRVNPSLADCDNKFLHVEESINPLNRIIAASGFYVMSRDLIDDTYAIKLENFVADDHGPLAVGQKLKTVINDHYKVKIAAENPLVAGNLRNFAVAFGANLENFGINGAVNISLVQISGTNASINDNAVTISALYAPNGLGYGSPVTIQELTIELVNREIDPLEPVIFGADITVKIIS